MCCMCAETLISEGVGKTYCQKLQLYDLKGRDATEKRYIVYVGVRLFMK